MPTAEGSGGSDGYGGEMKLPQLERSRGIHRGVFTRRATAIRQAGGSLEDVQALLEFLINRRRMLTELDSQIQLLIEDDDELVADLEEAADVFMTAERAVKWCQGKIKEMQPPSASGAVAPSSGSLTTKLAMLNLHSAVNTHSGSLSGTNSQHWLTVKLTWPLLKSYHTSSCHRRVMQLR